MWFPTNKYSVLKAKETIQKEDNIVMCGDLHRILISVGDA